MLGAIPLGFSGASSNADHTFASADESLAAGLLGRSGCIVLGIHLEGMTGFELHERLVESVAGPA